MRRPKKITPPILPMADQWALMYGETVTQVQAGKILGVSRRTIFTHIEAGHFEVTKQGRRRVYTRSMAAYVEGQGEKKVAQ